MSARSAPSLTRTASLWFGDGASEAEGARLAADLLSAVVGVAGAAAGALFVRSMWAGDVSVAAVVLDFAIPGLAMVALLVTAVLGLRAAAHFAEESCLRLQAPRFGRKGLIVSSSSVLFAFSCVYRALNIADEGAAMCRHTPTPFNAPVAGRFVATIGEVALVVQMSVYIDVTAARLGATRGLWSGVFSQLTSLSFSTIVPAVIAETMSWTGVLSGNSKFYCVEYVLWMIIAMTWTWDGAELLHKSGQWKEQLAHAALLIGGLALFFFNALFEIPHFFSYEREGAEVGGPVRLWECVQDANSPLWLKRLPFFFFYFIGCSWASVAVTYCFLRGLRRKGK